MILFKYLTATLIIIEIALNAKVYLHDFQKERTQPIPDQNTYRVLIIGDSISNDYPEELKKKLIENYPKKKFSFNNLIFRNATLNQVNNKLNSTLIKTHPNLTITMLGKSELNNLEKAAKIEHSENFLSKIQIYKLSLTFISQLRIGEYFSFHQNSPEIEPQSEGSYITEQTDQTGKDLLLSENWNAAQKYYEKKLESNMNSTEVNSILAEVYLKQGKHKQALKPLLKAAELSPDDQNIYSVITNAFIQTKNFDAAEVWAFKGISLFPKNPKIIISLINLYGDQGKFENVNKFCKKLYSIKINEHLCNYYKGIALYQTQQYDDALKQFHVAKNLTKYHSHIDQMIGLTLYESDKKLESFLYYKKSLTADLFNQNKNYKYIIRGIELGKLEELNNFYFNEIQKKHPNKKIFDTVYARLHIEKKEFKKAYLLLRTTLKEEPNNLYALKTINLLRGKMKNFKGEIEKFNKRTNTPHSDYKRIYPKVIARILKSNSKLIVMQYPDIDFSSLNNLNIAQDKNLFFIDSKSVFLKQEKFTPLESNFVWDGLHLSPIGSRNISKKILEVIQENSLI